MIRKFFPLDKNYLLEEAQLVQQDTLLIALVEKVKLQYQLKNNPLHLEDSFSKKISSYRPGNLEPLYSFYQSAAGVYRFKFGDNQLELLWGGESHFEKYKRDWAAMFDEWTTLFCEREQFIQAILDVTVFLPHTDNIQMAENRMNFVMLNFFDLRIHKSRGIVAMKIA